MKRLLFLFILGSGAIFFFLTHSSQAVTDPSAWLSTKVPEFKVKEAAVADVDYPASISGNGNISCDSLTFTKRDGGLFSPVPKLYKESKHTGCFVNSIMGAWDSNGYVNVPGTNYVAQTINSQSQPVGFSTYPNTDLYVSNVSSAPVGLYLWFDHLYSSLTYTTAVDGKIFARIQPKNPVPLTDKTGNMLPLMSNNMSLSENGDWLVVDSPARGLLRINTNTMEVLPFTNSFEYGNGIGAAIKTAISGDGRYAVVASKNYQTFRLFDLSTCEAVPNTITKPVNCSYRDLLPFFNSKVPALSSVLQMRFLTNNLLNVYASYGGKIGLFAVAAPDTPLNGMDYLALGDSFSSGEGAHKYEVGTDYPENLCHLSQVSYPYIINRDRGFNSFNSVACSGAQKHKIIGGKGKSRGKPTQSHDNQYFEETPLNSLGSWQPGYYKQSKFVVENDPQIITLTLGGNDIAFSDKLIRCLKPATCYPSYEDKKEVFTEIERQFDSLTTAYKTIKKSAPKSARIYVIGYPQIALSTGNCALNVRLEQDELEFASSVITQLNSTIKSAAEKAGVFYVDISDAFYGFRLCENDTGNIAMNGLTAGNDIAGFVGNESFHPNEFGHELMANKILGVTNNLTAVLPSADATKTAPKVSEETKTLKNSTKTGRKQNKTTPTNVTAAKTKKGSKVKVSLKGNEHGTAPNTTYQVSVGSTTTPIVSDSNGDIDVDITIPETEPTGPTEVHVVGDDVTGETTDYNDDTYIEGNENDQDDDNVLDTSDSCLLIPNTNVDYDQDSIDDACDPLIGPAPVTPTTPTGQQTDTSTNSPTIENSLVETTDTPTLPTIQNTDTAIAQEVLATSTQPLEVLPLSYIETGTITFTPSPAKPVIKSMASIHDTNLTFTPKPVLTALRNETISYAKTKPEYFSLVIIFLVLAGIYEIRKIQKSSYRNALFSSKYYSIQRT